MDTGDTTQVGMQANEDGYLQLDLERMRETGHYTIDALVDELTRARTEPIVRATSVDDLQRRLEAPPPEQGQLYAEVLAEVFADVTPFCTRPDAAGYMAFIPGFTTWPSAMADLIASALNLDSCWWAGGAGATQLELTVLGWFADWLGYPPDASGVLVSGGSAANLTALACARERRVGAMRGDLVVYISAQSHSSMARAARALGFRPERVRVLPVDRSFHLRVDVLEKALTADRTAGLKPLAVCANAGTTNTGAVDPLNELAGVCAEHDAWLHVDGAFADVLPPLDDVVLVSAASTPTACSACSAHQDARPAVGSRVRPDGDLVRRYSSSALGRRLTSSQTTTPAITTAATIEAMRTDRESPRSTPLPSGAPRDSCRCCRPSRSPSRCR